jgi:hypothetical protein
VIAGHHQRGGRQAVDEPPRLAELLGLGALGEVARQDDGVGPAPRRELLDLLGKLGEVGRPEVDIGDVEQVAQGATPP